MSTTKYGRLTEADIRGIVHDLHAGVTREAIAKRHRCSRTTVYLIQHNRLHREIVARLWSEIEQAEDESEPTEEELEAMVAENYPTMPSAKRGRRSRKDSEE